MISPALLRSQFLAALVGLLLGLACSLLPSQGFPPFLILVAPLWGVGFYAIPTFLGILLLRWLAVRIGHYDGFTILAGVIALALSFGLAYVSSLDKWLTSRGEIHGTMIGGGPAPEDLGGQALVLGSLAAWIAFLVWAALKGKRRGPGAPEPLDRQGKAAVQKWLALDSILIGVITAAILHHSLVQRREWTSPNEVIARAIGVINDQGSSAGDRALALNTLERSHDPRATELLRREAREDTGDNQIRAAVSLLGIDDKLALSVLEKPLMQGSALSGKIQPTTSHTPSEGFGVRVASFGTIGTWPYGRSVEKVRDPDVAPVLVRLMGAPAKETREGAASALRKILALKSAGGDRWVPDWPSTVDLPSVTAAMVRALDDPDEMVRYFAVCTLMEATDDPHYPAVSIFKANEQADLEQWKNWARANGVAQ
jgi:hypothetical protein